jgi:hypothetical protein
MRNAIIFAATALLAAASGLHAQGPQSLTMTNAVVVSVDPSQRIMVIRNTEGRQQTVELDDQLAGFAGIRPGDDVVLSLRKGPGRDRVMAIEKSRPVPPGARTTTRRTPTTSTSAGTSGTATSSAAPVVKEEARDARVRDTVEPRDAAALDAYADRVAAFSQQATEVDRLWGETLRVCNATVDANYEAREWVSLWDRQVRLDTSAGSCRELLNQVISAGETINSGMASAAEAARRAGAAEGGLREIRIRYSMDWDGWGRTPPARFTQP